MAPGPANGDAFVLCEFYEERYLDEAPFPDLPLTPILQDMAKGDDTGLHRHEDFYSLYVVSGGQGIHIINGHPYHLVRGDVYIALPGSVHAYRDFENLKADVFCFQSDVFSPEQLEALRSLPGFWNLRVDDPATAGAQAGHEHMGAARGHRLHLSPERHRETEAMLAELSAEISRKDNDYAVARALVPLLFFRLLVFLARAHDEKPGAAPPTTHDAGLAAVLRICEEHYAEPLSVPQLAATMFLSPGRFSEVFSAQMGIAPATYIRRLRLERAQTLLGTTDLPAAAVASQVGFNDAAQFSRAFHAAFGVTPSEYRARFGK